MSKEMTEVVATAEQPKSWFGHDSVLVPVVTAAYMGAVTQLGLLIEHPTLEAKVCLIIAILAPLVFPVGAMCEELSEKWKKRKV
jgi:hypothetical protein